MHEFACSEPVTLRILAPGITDGKVSYREKNAAAIIVESHGFTPKDGASATFEFLIPGSQELPPGSQIIWRGKVYDIANTRHCRDLDGATRAIRCSVC